MKTKFVYLSILLAFSLSGVNAAVPDCQSVVIGSGVAGMKAAMDLKDGGNKVCLIEKMPFCPLYQNHQSTNHHLFAARKIINGE